MEISGASGVTQPFPIQLFALNLWGGNGRFPSNLALTNGVSNGRSPFNFTLTNEVLLGRFLFNFALMNEMSLGRFLSNYSRKINGGGTVN